MVAKNVSIWIDFCLCKKNRMAHIMRLITMCSQKYHPIRPNARKVGKFSHHNKIKEGRLRAERTFRSAGLLFYKILVPCA